MKTFEVPVMPLKARVPFYFVERGSIEVVDSALVVSDYRGIRAQLPVGATAVLFLEPGSNITHAAMKLCAESRTLVIWVGEGGVRLYSAGKEGASHSYRLLRQARLALNNKTRLAVVREMYRLRFGSQPPQRRSVEQLRGMEGARVRNIYQELSEKYQVAWERRDYDRSDWGAQDLINRAVSAANSCLYGLCHAAILIAGLSPAIGFIHTGYPLAFVHDIADLYKMEIATPVAFEIVAKNEEHPIRKVRHMLRDRFRKERLLEKIIPEMMRLFDVIEPEKPEELAGTKPDELMPEDAPWYHFSVDPPEPEPETKKVEVATLANAAVDDGLPF